MAKETTAQKTREVEYYRCWAGNGGDSGTWDTDFIAIPASTSDAQRDAAVREATAKIAWTDESPVFVGYYAELDVDLNTDGERKPGGPSQPKASHRRAVVAELLAKLDAAHRVKGKTAEDSEDYFDETVHDIASGHASDINNGGAASQLEYIYDNCGEAETRTTVDKVIKAIKTESEQA